MYQYIIFGILVISLIYNKCSTKKLQKNNEEIEEMINNIGIDNIMKSLNSDEEFKKASKKLDESLEVIIKKEQ
jgi:uncharacterized metal-binding protein